MDNVSYPPCIGCSSDVGEAVVLSEGWWDSMSCSVFFSGVVDGVSDFSTTCVTSSETNTRFSDDVVVSHM